MANPIDKALKKVFNKVGPQNWNEDIQDWDFSRGNNKGKYTHDQDTHTKLDSIVAEQQAQKALIEATNQRLDETINVQGDMSLTGSYLQVKEVNADSGSLTTPPGGTRTATVSPPQGYIWRVPLVWAFINNTGTTATSGFNQLELKHGIDDYRYLVLRLRSNFADGVRVMANVGETATMEALPTDQLIQQQAIQNLVISPTKPLIVTFVNNTNGDVTNLFELRLIVTEERVTT